MLNEYPYWWDTVPLPEYRGAHGGTGSRESPEDTGLIGHTFDVVIVGAGYTGLAAACQLRRAGASVVVLEADRVGAGASSRNAGQVLTGLRVDAATLVDRYGERKARQLFDVSKAASARLESIIHDEAIDCEYQRTGQILAAWKPSHFAAFRHDQALLARVFDHRVDIVAPGDQQSELGSRRYHGLLVDEQGGALNPARYVQGLAAAARRAGAAIVTGTAVERLARRDKGWIVTTGSGDVGAGDVLIATNGYTTAATPELQRRLVPIGSYIVATEPLGEAAATRLVPRGRMVYDSKHFLYYFRRTSDHRLLFGGRAAFTQPAPNTARRAAGILRRGMVAVFPDLAETRIDYAWGGKVAFTRDEMPHAGLLSGMYYAGGYCGHGIAMATYLGELTARRMAGELMKHPFSDDQFSPIPFYYGTPWFLPAVGAYYRMKDWIH